MIWIWLIRAVAFLERLFMPPAYLPRVIDVNVACPACGHRQGSIRFERAHIGKVNDKPMVKHTCSVCAFTHYEMPVAVPEYPAQ